MTHAIRFLSIDSIAFDPHIPQRPTDWWGLFSRVHLWMPAPDQIPPLEVRFDPDGGKYLLLCAGPAYTDEGLPLQAAPLLGLSNLPCRVVGTAPAPPADEPGPTPPPRPPQPQTAPPPCTGAGRGAPDPVRLDALFRDLRRELSRLAQSAGRRAGPAARRVADEDDWAQEAALALWRELCERDPPRLTGADEVRRYVQRLCHNQAARSANVGRRTSPLSDDCADRAGSVLEEVIAAEQGQRLDQALRVLEALLGRAQAELEDALARLPGPEARALGAWLDGAAYRKAAAQTGVGLGRLRGLAWRLGTGRSALARLLREARARLRAAWRAHPEAAARLPFGRLRRLLAAG